MIAKIPGPKPTNPVGVTVAHGLLSFDSGWQHALVTWANTTTRASWSSLDYFEGILGWFHQQHVDALSKLLLAERSLRPAGKQHYIGHSNGCRVLLESMLQTPGLVLDDVHLIAAWVVRDCDKSGINQLLLDGRIKRLFLYVSSRDDVLGWNFLSGRTLGKDGPTNVKQTCVINYDNTETHTSWVDPRAGDTLGFNQSTFPKIITTTLGD